MRANPKIAGTKKGFTAADIAGLCRIVTRLESCAQELISAGF
jgi:hypothetical protein